MLAEQLSVNKQLKEEKDEIQAKISQYTKDEEYYKAQSFLEYGEYEKLTKERDMLSKAIEHPQQPKLSLLTLKQELEAQQSTLAHQQQQIQLEQSLIDKIISQISTIEGSAEQLAVVRNADRSTIRFDQQTIYFPATYEQKAVAYDFFSVSTRFMPYLGQNQVYQFNFQYQGAMQGIIEQVLQQSFRDQPVDLSGVFREKGEYFDLFTRQKVAELATKDYNCTHLPVKSAEHAVAVLQKINMHQELLLQICGKFYVQLLFGAEFEEFEQRFPKTEVSFFDLEDVKLCEQQLKALKAKVKSIEIDTPYACE